MLTSATSFDLDDVIKQAKPMLKSVRVPLEAVKHAVALEESERNVRLIR